uniref:Uncharacterized protein n=1 Tax=Anguilla anguilla TaxID=7936 RepID=A0A0E9RB49_ANGAN
MRKSLAVPLMEGYSVFFYLFLVLLWFLERAGCC